MGLTRAKSGIVVKNNKSFLQLIIDQVRILNQKYKSSVPLVLMNSRNTEEETAKAIQLIRDVQILTFNQEYYPRLDADSMIPLPQGRDSSPECWYPPGHGNIYDSLESSGMLDTLLARGIDIIFISNSDNLGATIDINLVASLYNSDADILVEVTNKTPRDVKGGAIVQYKTDAGLIYKDLEIAQVPEENLQAFHSFPHFNTGNLWVKLPFLKSALRNQRLKLDVIKNYKVLHGKRILQLETASGSLVSTSKNVQVVNVPRSRFVPTKSCTDLAIIMSDCYRWDAQDGVLRLDPRMETVPRLLLPDEFTSLQELEARFMPIPSMVQLHSLTIKGNVYFSPGIILKGDVEIIANSESTLILPSNSLLDNVHVEGSLVILKL